MGIKEDKEFAKFERNLLIVKILFAAAFGSLITIIIISLFL